MISSLSNLVYALSHELPNGLRLRILGNKEIGRESSIWVETEPSAHFPFKKLNFGTSSQKTDKSRYQTCLILFTFTGFLYFVPNIFPMIVWANKFLVWTRPSLLQTWIFWHFICYQSISAIFNQNKKQFSCFKIPSLTVLCKQYFPISP